MACLFLCHYLSHCQSEGIDRRHFTCGIADFIIFSNKSPNAVALTNIAFKRINSREDRKVEQNLKDS